MRKIIQNETLFALLILIAFGVTILTVIHLYNLILNYIL